MFCWGHQQGSGHQASPTRVRITETPHTGTQVHTPACCRASHKVHTHPPSQHISQKAGGIVCHLHFTAEHRGQGQGRGMLKVIQVSESPGALSCFSFPGNAAVMVEGVVSTFGAGGHEMLDDISSTGTQLFAPAASPETGRHPEAFPITHANYSTLLAPCSPQCPGEPWPGPIAVSQDLNRPLLQLLGVDRRLKGRN